MPRRVDIIKIEPLFEKFIFRIEEATLRHERFDGTMSDQMTRLSFERGESVAAVLHNVTDDTLILTEQFRYPTYAQGTGWMLELPAGVVEEGEDPAETMKRELVEEIGYEVASLRPINIFYVSPGGASERIHLFYASVTPQQQTGKGGGLASEHEDIRRITMKVSEALIKVNTGAITDAKTIIGIQWVALNRR